MAKHGATSHIETRRLQASNVSTVSAQMVHNIRLVGWNVAKAIVCASSPEVSTTMSAFICAHAAPLSTCLVLVLPWHYLILCSFKVRPFPAVSLSLFLVKLHASLCTCVACMFTTAGLELTTPHESKGWQLQTTSVDCLFEQYNICTCKQSNH